MLNKKMLLSLLVIGVVSVSAGAGTWAYFSDTEMSTDNTFTAGTLDLDLSDGTDDGTDSETLTWVAGNMAPGDVAASATMTVTNVGTLAGNLDISDIDVLNDPGTTPESEDISVSEDGELGANLIIDMFFDTNNDGVNDASETTIYTGALDGIAASYDLDEGIAASGVTYITINYDLPSTTGNDVQGDTVELEFTVELDQIAD
jgi:predicted ribosomally synthesized peptide with SipW-like signal peptide